LERVSTGIATGNGSESGLQVILVHQRLTQAKTLTFTARDLAVGASLFLLIMLACSVLLNFLTFRLAERFDLPLLHKLIAAANHAEERRKEQHLRDNIDAMATRLGELQAQMMRLEALGERVSGLAGIKPQSFDFQQSPGRGGLDPLAGRPLSVSEFQDQLDRLGHDLDHRSDYLSVVESELMSAKLKSKMMPTILPVDVGYNASGFGWRIDPFTGRLAKHEGIDFIAPSGTNIVAAAGGVVIRAEWHQGYGNMVEIDHGNDMTTLYAHASKLRVGVGDIVRHNQHIADVGSTGRSTGAHLHFEVHVKGVPQNPAKFLAGGARPKARQIAAATATPQGP